MIEAPLFRDPIYDAPTDPVVIWNNERREWWMFYTQRRASRNIVGVAHIHGSTIGVATSPDGNNWLITDEWNGLGVYESEDVTNWTKNGVILREGGSREWDGVMGNHADVVVHGDEAYIFYFTHPYFRNEDRLTSGFVMGEQHGRTCIQAARLTVKDGVLCGDRNEDFDFKLV